MTPSAGEGGKRGAGSTVYIRTGNKCTVQHIDVEGPRELICRKMKGFLSRKPMYILSRIFFH